MELDVLVVLDAVAEPLEPHGGTDARDADLVSRIEKHTLSWIRGRVAVNVVPGIGCPEVGLPVEDAREAECLVDEAGLDGVVDGDEVEEPLG